VLDRLEHRRRLARAHLRLVLVAGQGLPAGERRRLAAKSLRALRLAALSRALPLLRRRRPLLGRPPRRPGLRPGGTAPALARGLPALPLARPGAAAARPERLAAALPAALLLAQGELEVELGVGVAWRRPQRLLVRLDRS